MLRQLGSTPLEPQEQQRLIERLEKAIVRRCRPEAVYIFGSAASKELTNASDLDVACIFQDQQTLSEGRKRLAGLAGELGVGIDLLCFTTAGFAERADKGGLATEIKTRGKKLL